MNRVKGDELVDIFDENYKAIGTCGLAEAHRRGFWHSVVHLWLIDSRTGSLVYQRRSRWKTDYPRYWDISVAGHSRHGETCEATLQREAMEELGLSVDTKTVLSLGIRRHASVSTARRNCEFQNVFLGCVPVDPTTLDFQDGEVEGVCLLTLAQAATVLAGERHIRTECWEIGRVRRTVELTTTDFVPTPDGYNAKIVRLAMQFLGGNHGIQL